ncbi:AlpA family phage regulatory protein [Paracoccus sp. TK19116]|uniref:AlpA family phage regulatory protein n=1 Tax=Paracoccus albicereus TaxID=2922394 RepID=A0ABT1MUR5_9RHOB|nr:AlpA family phage regulatory protein [Paracoccus albicereus]MCQ0972087.1 AlpA family phage regulatory protein [Paracoccus albicereus]
MMRKDNRVAGEDLRLINKNELCKMLAASEASVDRWLRSDPSFPQPRRLGPGSIRWVQGEVIGFIEQLAKVEYEDHAFSPDLG